LHTEQFLVFIIKMSQELKKNTFEGMLLSSVQYFILEKSTLFSVVVITSVLHVCALSGTIIMFEYYFL